jgi:hypothetical protein
MSNILLTILPNALVIAYLFTFLQHGGLLGRLAKPDIDMLTLSKIKLSSSVTLAYLTFLIELYITKDLTIVIF